MKIAFRNLKMKILGIHLRGSGLELLYVEFALQVLILAAR